MATSICRISRDSVAQSLCVERVREGDRAADFKTGLTQTRFVQDAGSYRPTRVKTRPDSDVSGPEIYERVANHVASWQQSGLRLDFLRGRLDIPWLADDLNTQTQNDAVMRRTLQRQIDVIRTRLIKEKLRVGSPAYNRKFHRHLYAYMIRPRANGGLGLRFDNTPGQPRSAIEVYRDREAACQGFVAFYMMVADMAGLPVVPLEMFENSSGTAMHVAIGLRDPSTRQLSLIIDLMTPKRFGPPEPGEVWSEMSRREVLAYAYNARGVHHHDSRQGEAYIDFAMRINPGNYLIHFNKSYHLARRGQLAEAKQQLMASIKANPTYAPAYYNLNNIALRLGENELATWAWQQYSTALGQSPAQANR